MDLSGVFMWTKILTCFVILVGTLLISAASDSQLKYTVISDYDYHAVVQQSENDIKQLIDLLKPYQNKPNYIDQIINISFDLFKDRPYIAKGVAGEGDWCPGDIDRHGCPHIKQDPIYRTDAFVCNTLVQIVLALLNANSLQDYNKNYLSITYGAANEPPSSIHYYNRNNFISADFNPVNQRNGLIKDVTSSGIFSKFVKQTSSIIDRQEWFNRQMEPHRVGDTVRVLSAKDGPSMVKRALNNYPAPFHKFTPINVAISYIPKEVLVEKEILPDGRVTYKANETLINQLPIPSIIEIVRDSKQWKVGGKNIIQLTGSGINVSHLGFLHQASFKKGDIIFRKIICTMKDNQKTCTVVPVICTQANGCTKIMMTHATEAYPQGYYYYQDNKGIYHCSADKPTYVTSSTKCNRVVSLPLGDYLVTERYGKYVYLEESSILGIHLEKILNKKSESLQLQQ